MSLKGKTIVGNIYFAFAAQGVSYLTSALTSLVVPKLLGVEEFGYWQLFLLYASYAGLADLGIAEGVYLKYGGLERQNLDNRNLSGQFIIFTILQVIIAAGVLLAAAVLDLGNRTFVLAATAFYLLIINLSSYSYYLLQAINETRRYSIAIILSKFAFMVMLIPLLLLRVDSFEPYLICYDIAQIASLLYCLRCCHDIILVKPGAIDSSVKAALQSIHIGYKLLIANLTSTLLIGIARLMVDSAWDIELFGQLSLAFTLCSFFMQCVYQFSMVLFPALRRLDNEHLGSFYSAAQIVLNSLLPLVFVFYFPIALLINYWLPAYNDVVTYFGMLLPLCIFDGRMDILGNTFLKVIRKEKLLMQINLTTVACGAVALAIATYIIGSIDVVIWTLVAAVCFRCFFTESYISKSLQISNSIHIWTSLIVAALFILLTHWGLSFPSFLGTCAIVIGSIALNAKRLNAAAKVIRP